jgi:hypothetical protein
MLEEGESGVLWRNKAAGLPAAGPGSVSHAHCLWGGPCSGSSRSLLVGLSTHQSGFSPQPLTQSGPPLQWLMGCPKLLLDSTHHTHNHTTIYIIICFMSISPTRQFIVEMVRLCLVPILPTVPNMESALTKHLVTWTNSPLWFQLL